MKLFVFSDLHRSEMGLEKIVSAIKDHDPDLVICCGDITTFGPRSFAMHAVSSLDRRTLAVPGNCDPQDLHDVFNEGDFTNIDGRSMEMSGFNFIGWGGANPGVNTPYERSEDDIRTGLGKIFENCPDAETMPVILVSHCPPYGFQDTIPDGTHVGCTSVADMIDRYRPPLTLCGHIHEARGFHTDTERKLHIVNVGPSRDGYCAIIELVSPGGVIADPINNIKIHLID